MRITPSSLKESGFDGNQLPRDAVDHHQMDLIANAAVALIIFDRRHNPCGHGHVRRQTVEARACNIEVNVTHGADVQSEALV